MLVDTPVWSAALRRKRALPAEELFVRELTSLVEDGRVAMIGPVRQEILSGIKDRGHFERLRDHLRAFPDTEIRVDDYEEAAVFFNRCRAKGVQGSNTDFLICAVAARMQYPVLTTEADFARYARLLPVALHAVRA